MQNIPHRDGSPNPSNFITLEGSSSNYLTPPKKASLNPDSPAFVPVTTAVKPISSVSAFRVDAPEFTPTKSTIPLKQTTTQKKILRPDVSGMESRLWMSPEIHNEMEKYNHWLLFKDNPVGFSQWPSEIQGYCDFLSFENTGIFDITPKFTSEIKFEIVKTGRARKTSSNELFTILVFKDIELSDGSVFSHLDAFRRLESPFILRIIESFTTHAFGTGDLIVVYESAPGGVKIETILNAFSSDEFSCKIELWIYQLIWLLYTVHKAGLSFDGSLCMQNLVISGSGDRIILVGFGIYEMMMAISDPSQIPSSLQSRQSLDYQDLLKILETLSSFLNQKSEEFIRVNNNILQKLPTVEEYSLDQISSVILNAGITDRILIDMHKRSILLESNLAIQSENDRLFRLICKLSFVNQRRSHAHDNRWSETGERYILVLFRDFVFQSQDEAGAPVISYFHVIDVLNKLDAASKETIMLMSRDGAQCIFTSYAEIKERLESSYAELVGS